MLSVRCPSCDKVLKVKDELAGKKVKCPACAKVLPVPQPAAIVSSEVKQSPDARAHEDRTLPPASRPPSAADEVTLPPGASALRGQTVAWDAPDDGERGEVVTGDFAYAVEGEIARGGMGAVMRAVDQDIRREVALKFLLNPQDERQKVRFLEEAQITGQLEHPNIVPIHQLGVHEDGRCFFSMKMVKGRSLADILKAQTDANGSNEFTLGRLLNVFSSVCNALAYAHSRNVIHRDLKPANIMVGDFGEVYVMDWGLAKVLGKESGDEQQEAVVRGQKSGGRRGKVATSRAVDANLTQAGAIMGTPAYMPPEQATGEAVDDRSDIYSLGAILYEILTLSPPVGREGDMLAILMRVAEGDIQPPEKQTPERARRGLIPPELSAVAMKALSREPADRYQTVEALQRDIQLFLEGRSVSARRDTAWELFKKLVKRNKGVSVATAAALGVLAVVLGLAFHFINQERQEAVAARDKAEENYRRAEDNHNALLREQEEKRASNKKSAPAFVAAARLLAADTSQFAHALTQVNTALEYDPDQTEAYLLKGQMLFGLGRYAEAAAPLEEYLRRKPGDAHARRLAELAQKPEPDTAAYFVNLYETFERQKQLTLAGLMTHRAERFLGPQRERLPLYQKRLETAWPGSGPQLTLSEIGEFQLSLAVPDLRDVQPLKEMPLSLLKLPAVKLESLEPLRGMPLRWLEITGSYDKGSPLRDLSPLQGMKLTRLEMTFVRDIPSLEPLRGMPLEHLFVRGNSRLTSLGPLRGMPLAFVFFWECPTLADIEGLRDLKLRHVTLSMCPGVKDLSPLMGQPVESLNIDALQDVRDFSFLRGMRLRSFVAPGCTHFRDLELIQDMPLTELWVGGCPIQTLAPLRNLKNLSILNVGGCTAIRDFEPLRGLPLTKLFASACPHLSDLEVLRGMKLQHLAIADCANVTDLSPLDGMPLQTVALTPALIKNGWDVLRRVKSLGTVEVSGRGKFDAAEFWQRYDKGEFKK